MEEEKGVKRDKIEENSRKKKWEGEGIAGSEGRTKEEGRGHPV